MADVILPSLGESVTEGIVTRWMKQVGEQVERDEPLYEISTDKVDSEMPAPAAGVLTEILVAEGDTVAVGARLAIISEDGAEVAAAPASSLAPATTSSAAPPAAAAPQTAWERTGQKFQRSLATALQVRADQRDGPVGPALLRLAVLGEDEVEEAQLGVPVQVATDQQPLPVRAGPSALAQLG